MEVEEAIAVEAEVVGVVTGVVAVAAGAGDRILEEMISVAE